jgi:hypothetical protein
MIFPSDENGRRIVGTSVRTTTVGPDQSWVTGNEPQGKHQETERCWVVFLSCRIRGRLFACRFLGEQDRRTAGERLCLGQRHRQLVEI